MGKATGVAEDERKREVMTKDDIVSVQMTLVDYDKVKAYVTVTMSNGMVIKGIRMIPGKKGLFPAMPSRATKDKATGKDAWENSVIIPDEDDNKLFQKAIYDEYNRLSSSGQKSSIKREPVEGTPTESFSKQSKPDVDYLC